MKADFTELDLKIARARVVLSIVALISIYIDPDDPGPFQIERYALLTLILHFVYSTSTYAGISRRLAPEVWPNLTAVLDVLFAAAIVLFTEGPTSAGHVFFLFAIVAVNCRTGFRAALAVTLSCGFVYFLLLTLSSGSISDPHVMRAGYLTIDGYIIGFIGQQRVNFETRLRELETSAERHRIARSLHDGYVQALAGVSLRLETCRELLARDRGAEALAQLQDLQTGVSREFDQVRDYVRSLADIDRTLSSAVSSVPETRFRIEAGFAASGLVVEQIIQIMLEGMRNALRHGNAQSAVINASQGAGVIRITIDDDGVGFRDPSKPPWSIASRVAEFGGRLRMLGGQARGAHLEIEMPVG